MYASCAFVPGELRVSARELRVRVHESARSCPPTCGQLGPAGARRAGGVGRVRQGGRMTTSPPAPSRPAPWCCPRRVCSPRCSTCSCRAPAAAAPLRGRAGAPAVRRSSARRCGRCCPVGSRSRPRAGTAGGCAAPFSSTRNAGGATSPAHCPPCSSRRWARSAGAGDVWLVPAPSRPSAARARGGDHVLRLCRHLARGDPGRSVAPALRLGRRARDSVGLDAAAAGGEPGGAPPGGRPGLAAGGRDAWSLSTTSSPPARRYGPAGRPSLGPIATLRQLSFLPTRPHGKHARNTRMVAEKTTHCRTCTDRGHSNFRSVVGL